MMLGERFDMGLTELESHHVNFFEEDFLVKLK